MSGQKTLLTISGCNVSKDGVVSVDSSRPVFEAMINPAGYEHGFTIRYTKNEAFGASGSEAKFNAAQAEKLTLKALVLDGTGAVPGVTTPVKQQVELLRNTVYTYVGVKHEAPIVQLVWGSLIFYGRVESLKFDYTLFMPNGDPLRAKVSMGLVEYSSAPEITKSSKKSSPDLTHLVMVRAGDTLPLLCERIYRNPAYYLEVARINGLTAFRQLQPGTSLRFPPLG
jgi:nucleoid-associated protein YgaU